MTAASDFLFDVEAELRSADDLARACFMMLETGRELGADDAGAVLRVVCHLQDHTAALLKAWTEAMAIERAGTRAAA